MIVLSMVRAPAPDKIHSFSRPSFRVISEWKGTKGNANQNKTESEHFKS